MTAKLTRTMHRWGCAALVALAVPAGASVSVVFTQLDNYTDMPFSESGKTDVLKALEAHFAQLAKRLPPGRDLKIEVLDIDLAGRIEPGARYPVDMRILRGSADWPAMSLRYRIEESGKTIKSGDARLADLNYLRHHNRYSSGDLIRYEKAMIDDWFRTTVLDDR